jgi:hypothetical protein
MNPILPRQLFVPDVEARQWADGRIYLYGSLDTSGDTFYCSEKYRVFSSSDLVEWTDHGISFDLERAHTADASRLFAPDCICRDGRYYLLYCGNDSSEGIARSAQPYGPFDDAWAVEGADGDGIDPAALVDGDDVYYFWGQFELRGARLTDDLTAIDRGSFTPQLLTEKEHGFHEGASIRKRNGIYYLVYTDISRGKATSLAYATSDSPLGPYEKRGIIIDNDGCDPETWNNHGSIAEFNGQWYVFYHRSSQATRFNRRVCVEPIEFDDDGMIAEVEMTTQGVSGPLDASQAVDASRACLLSGRARIEPLHPTRPDEGNEEIIAYTHNGDWAAYKYLTFDAAPSACCITLASLTGRGNIEVRADHQNGPLLSVIDIPDTGGWRVWREVEAPLRLPVTRMRAIYLVFKGMGRLADVKEIAFRV